MIGYDLKIGNLFALQDKLIVELIIGANCQNADTRPAQI
jgi:hypothetical protein